MSLPPELAALADRFVLEPKSIDVVGVDWRIDRPRSAEDLINEADFAQDERLPYWADLWPSAIVLARTVASLAGEGRRALELGCGLGLPTLAALHAGWDVTATDYYDDALLFARRNARELLHHEPTTRNVDWRHFPTDLGRFDLVLAADVLYERPYAPLVARAVCASLSEEGIALVADPGRVALEGFVAECRALGARVTSRPGVRHEDGAAKHTITIHEVRLG